jgi:hypothetical protein
MDASDHPANAYCSLHAKYHYANGELVNMDS